MWGKQERNERRKTVVLRSFSTIIDLLLISFLMVYCPLYPSLPSTIFRSTSHKTGLKVGLPWVKVVKMMY